MPLPPPVDREPMHNRRYDFAGYRRGDGLWDIEGRMTDTKPYGFASRDRGEVKAGEPLHDMWIRLTLDEGFEIHAVEAATEAGPFNLCPAITPNYQRLVGERIRPGWNNRVKELFAGTEGCTHLTEMLGAMGTVAFQTLYPVRARKAKANGADANRRPPLIDSCHAFASDGEVVRRQWPEHYTGRL